MKKVHLACQYFLNSDLEEAELRRQVKMLAQSGYESIYGHARQGLITPYFSKKYWDSIKVVADECRKNNVNFSIWDEDCFPSGVAGNRILWSHPELSVKHLEFSVFEAKVGERVYEILPAKANVLRCFAVSDDEIEDITEYCGTLRGDVKYRKLLHSGYSPTRKITMPHWRSGWPGRRLAIDYCTQSDCKIVVVQLVNYTDEASVSNNTDLMNPQTTKLFLELTHQEYLKQLGTELFNSTVDASFLDEPNPGFFYCWSTNFAEEFQKMHNFDLLPLLPHLVLDIDDKTLFVRHCYRMTQQKLITENYLGQIGQWCKEHDIISTGHLSRSESLTYSNGYAWPNEMKCYSFLDIPCTDPLGAGAAWTDASAYHTGIKVVTSAAKVYGKSQAGSDALAVLGHEASIKDLIFHLDYQITMGLTYFNIHGLSYSLLGARKDEVPPSLFYQHSQWPWMKDFLKRAGKLCEILDGSDVICNIAMLYPGATFYCATLESRNLYWEECVHDLVEKMLSNQKDFIFFDEDAIVNIVARNLEKFVENYPYFVIPSLRYLPRNVANILEAYANAGGKLLVTGDIPILFGPDLNSKSEKWQAAEKYQVEDIISVLPGSELTGKGARDIILQQRLIDNKTAVIFFNRAEVPFTGKFNGKDIYLAPACGTLVLDIENLPQNPIINMTVVEELDNWDIDFPENHLAIPHWLIPGDIVYGDTQVNLLERKIPDVSKVKDLYYEMKFLYSGECAKLEFVIEDADFSNLASCFVNNVEITDFAFANFSDICFVSADISHAVLTGTSPRLNTIRLITKNNEELLETPFLRGNFKAEHRHSNKTIPFLQGFDGKLNNEKLQLWSAWGYGNFSGVVKYSKKIIIEESGVYKLDLGKVEGIAQLDIEQNEIAVLLKEPFVSDELTLSSGTYTITVTVANGPGNRDRLANLPSGLIGPVKLFKKL